MPGPFPGFLLGARDACIQFRIEQAGTVAPVSKLYQQPASVTILPGR